MFLFSLGSLFRYKEKYISSLIVLPIIFQILNMMWLIYLHDFFEVATYFIS